MRVAVLGAGVVGVATAYCLAEDGCEVTLVDRRDRAGGGTSWGNAGLVSPSDSYAWASPDALKTAVRSLWRSDLGIRYRLRLDPRLWLWSLKFLGQCTHAAARRNTLAKLRMALYSQEQLNRIVAETGVGYDGVRHGILYYFRTETSLRAAERHFSILRENGVAMETVDRARMEALEPALARAPEAAGGIYSPDCQTGDCGKFTRGLAEWCVANRGATLRLGETATRFVVENGRVARVLTDKGEVEADAFVLATGADSVFLGATAGLDLPIYPVKGFSLTAPLRDPEAGPRMGVVDEDVLVAMSPFGDRVRAASSAVFAGFDTGWREKDFDTIRRTVGTLYGDAVDLDKAERWAGLRPMTPSSVPILGRSPIENLFLNVGHGHLGWTMGCGSGRYVADVVAGRTPAISGEGYSPGSS